VTYAPAGEKPITGRVGVGTWNTAAEFRDIRVERGGKVTYQSDFTSGAAGWSPVTGRGQGGRGNWSAAGGAYRQSGNAIAFAFLDGSEAGDATISLRARKISGAEGFLVFGGTIDGRRVQWNVAGWGNTQSAIQANDAIVGRAVRGGIEAGRWYDLRLEIRGRTVRGYLDGQLLNEATYPRVDTVFAIAGRDDARREWVIKALNTGPDAASMTFVLQGARAGSTGQLITLSASDPLAENSFDAPGRIAPSTRRVTGLGPEFTQTLAPYSLNILRIPVR
jgi:alpha-L-arabinofuranosidase